MAILLLVGLAVFLGLGAVALNLTWLTSHKVELREACEAASLAGTAQLLDPSPGTTTSATDAAAAVRVAAAKAQANTFFAANNSAILQTTETDPDVVAGWCEDPTAAHALFLPWTNTGPVNSLFVRGVRRRSNGQAVVVWFGQLFGVGYAEPGAAAMATMDQRIYGFRPTDLISVPLIPLLAPATSQWPSGGEGTAGSLPDNYSIASRTRVVSTGADGVAEITLYAPLASGSVPSGETASNWIWLPTTTMDFDRLALQVTNGLDSTDLAGLGGKLALGSDGTLSIPVTAAPNTSQAAQLLTALLAIRGQKRILPLGSIVTVDGQAMYQVAGFVGGCVVDCSQNADCLTIVVQACTIQTCTGLLRSGMTRNPWIGKLILNE